MSLNEQDVLDPIVSLRLGKRLQILAHPAWEGQQSDQGTERVFIVGLCHLG